MLERDHNQYLLKRCKELGILIEKFVSPSGRSKPDWILITKGRVVFFEMKAPNKEPTDAQKRDHQRRVDHGAEVVWANDVKGIETILQYIVENLPLRNYKY